MDVGSRDEAMTAPLVQIAKQGVEARDWSWGEGSVWTDRMLSALSNGVKGGVWYSLMDKSTLRRRWRRLGRKFKSTAARRAWTGRASNGSRRTPKSIWRSCRESCGRANTVRRRSGAWRSRRGMAGCGRWGCNRAGRLPPGHADFWVRPINREPCDSAKRRANVKDRRCAIAVQRW